MPRSIACLVVGVPWEFLPLVYAWTAGLLIALVVTRIAFSQLPFWPRILGAFAMLAVPQSGEVFLNLTNMNWILGGLLALNLLEPAPAGYGSAFRRCAEILIAGLSGPLVILAMPFFVLWCWQSRRNRRSLPLAAAWALAFSLQAAIIFASSRSPTAGIGDVVSSLHWVIPRYATSVFIGQRLPHDLLRGQLLATAALLALALLLLDPTNRYRLRALLMFCAAAGLLVAGRLANDYWGNPFAFASRYTYIPLVLSLWACAWLATGATKVFHRSLALVFYILPVGAATSAWVASAHPQFDWPRQVQEAKEGRRTIFQVLPNDTFPVPQSFPREAISQKLPRDY